jgi:hypothetical protein
MIDHQNVLFRTGILLDDEVQPVPHSAVHRSGIPVTQTMWVDDLVIQSARP